MTDDGETVDEFDLPPGVREVPLRTMGDIQRELARLYRAAKAKRISLTECNGLTQTLMTLSKVTAETTAEQVLRRLEEIELKLQ